MTREGRPMLYYDLQFFAQEGPGGEKTEQATSKKLDDARKKGQVAKSQEVWNALSLLELFLVLRFIGLYAGQVFFENFRWVYGLIPEFTKVPEGRIVVYDYITLLNRAIIRMGYILLPILLLGFVLAFVVNLVQVKWRVTTEPLKPKFDKLSPLSGFKRLFSKQKLVDLLKSILKIFVVGYVAYTTISDRMGMILLLRDYSILRGIGLVLTTVLDMGLRIALFYLLIGAADYIYTRWKFNEDMKMTKQEVKDEYKDSEGDPQIKGKIKQKMMEASRRRMMQSVPDADVVITNPTHYAVALKYDAQVAEAPVVVAKGQDFLARRIKEIADSSGVEIVENKPLARMIYANVDLGDLIPPELYQAVAEVLAMVYNLKEKKKLGRNAL